MGDKINVNPNMLTWAVVRAGFDLAEFTKKESKVSGGNFYATTKKRLSVTFAAHINNAVKTGDLLYRDAYKLTSLKGDTFQTFFSKHI